jgi:pyruvate,water dikinase
MIMNAGLPEEVIQEVEDAYGDMCLCNLHSCGKDCAVAVRSSATAEDLPTASFAGQQASFLNVVGKNSVANTVLECLASVFTDRAIAYRVHNGFDHMAVKGAGEITKCDIQWLFIMQSKPISIINTTRSICSIDG